MRKVISASRRTDLVAHFPDWLARALGDERARVLGPSGHVYDVDLRPESVHTIVLWSKDFSNLVGNVSRLKDLLKKFDQVYFHFTVTGLGGTFIESHVRPPGETLAQLPSLSEIARSPKRISLRFDPVIFWREGKRVSTNFHFHETLFERARAAGVEDIRFSFAQWYGKALRRAAKHGFAYVDPSGRTKKRYASGLARAARDKGLRLYACAQSFLADVPGIIPSACIDGRRLAELHPRGEPASLQKDRSQRASCLCTESVDIGSYTQTCPHACLYCYANPAV